MISKYCKFKATIGPKPEKQAQKKLTFFPKISVRKPASNLLISFVNFSGPQFEWGTAYGGD
jgi:hypothetical protein